VHLTDNPVDWYALRAAGVVAYLLLTTVVVLGVLLSGRSLGPRWPRFAAEDVHRFTGLLVGVFVWLHVLTTAIDAYLPLSVTDLVVPFTAGYRPLWTGLGTVAAELLLALAVTNCYRSRLSYRFWRRAHYLNFPLWGLATLHAAFGGADGDQTWLVFLLVLSVVTVGAAVWVRVRRTRASAPARPARVPREAGDVFADS
jgi:sulfoxide reductase heme-binding subunit YedZ